MGNSNSNLNSYETGKFLGRVNTVTGLIAKPIRMLMNGYCSRHTTWTALILKPMKRPTKAVAADGTDVCTSLIIMQGCGLLTLKHWLTQPTQKIELQHILKPLLAGIYHMEKMEPLSIQASMISAGCPFCGPLNTITD